MTTPTGFIRVAESHNQDGSTTHYYKNSDGYIISNNDARYYGYGYGVPSFYRTGIIGGIVSFIEGVICLILEVLGALIGISAVIVIFLCFYMFVLGGKI